MLKLDPGNTELLAQKHRLLGQAVSETRDKLETLKTAAEQANTALANGEISQEQYDALQREIIETEQALERLEQQAGESAMALHQELFHRAVGGYQDHFHNGGNGNQHLPLHCMECDKNYSHDGIQCHQVGFPDGLVRH